jgi:hypothetical protein
MGEKDKKEKLYKNLITLIKLFSGRPLHLAKYLIENEALDKDFIQKIINNAKLSDMNDTDATALSKAIYFVDISHMKDYYNSLLDDVSKVESKRDVSKELNEKLDKFIREERYEDAIRIRDFMSKNNIDRKN